MPNFKLQRLIMSGFVGFAESGKTIDGVTVSDLARPDTTPADNFGTLGCIEQVSFDQDVETEDDYCPLASGNGYIKETFNNVVADYMDFTLKNHSEHVFRLLFGAPAEIVDGTAFKPFDVQTREIFGWINFQARGGGNTLLDGFIWGKLTLQDYPGFSKDATKPVLRFQVLESTLNQLTPASITT